MRVGRLVVCFVTGDKEAAYVLLEELLSHYDKDVRPVNTWSEPLVLGLDLALNQIIQLVSNSV